MANVNDWPVNSDTWTHHWKVLWTLWTWQMSSDKWYFHWEQSRRRRRRKLNRSLFSTSPPFCRVWFDTDRMLMMTKIYKGSKYNVQLYILLSSMISPFIIDSKWQNYDCLSSTFLSIHRALVGCPDKSSVLKWVILVGEEVLKFWRNLEELITVLCHVDSDVPLIAQTAACILRHSPIIKRRRTTILWRSRRIHVSYKTGSKVQVFPIMGLLLTLNGAYLDLSAEFIRGDQQD